MQFIVSDEPIKSCENDSLKRSKFAEDMARAIFNQPFSTNIGLYGKWGSGKTSLINMMEESLRKLSDESSDEKITIVRFDPWLFKDSDQLITQFFVQLSKELNLPDLEKKKKLGKGLMEFGELLQFIPSPVFRLGGVSLRYSGKKLKDKSSKNLQEMKNALTKELGNLNLKIVIFIDDIDRLSNTEIQTVFKLVKLIADFPNVFYVVAFDYDVVTNALSEVQKSSGEQYLEKIIQVPIHLPAINKTMLEEEFQKIFDNLGIDIDKLDKIRLKTLYSQGIEIFFDNIRDVKRLSNLFSLKYSLLKNEVDTLDLLGVVALQTFEPVVYSKLFYYKERLCTGFSGSDSEIYSLGVPKEKPADIFERLVASCLDTERQKAVKTILSVIFPNVKKPFDRNALPSSSGESGSVSNVSYFDRYFSLSLNEGLSLESMGKLFEDASGTALKNALLDYKERGLTPCEVLDYTLERLKKSEGKNDKWNGIVTSILQTWYLTMADNFEHIDFYEMNKLIETFLAVYSEEENRNKQIRSIFEDTNIPIGVKAIILFKIGEKRGRYSEEGVTGRAQDSRLSINLPSLENLFFTQVFNLEDVQLINDAAFNSIYALLKKFYEEEKRDYLDTLVRESLGTPLGKARLISALAIKISSLGLYVGDEEIKEYFDVEETRKCMERFVQSIDFSKLSLKQKKDVITFIVYDRGEGKRVSINMIEQYAERNKVSL